MAAWLAPALKIGGSLLGGLLGGGGSKKGELYQGGTTGFAPYGWAQIKKGGDGAWQGSGGLSPQAQLFNDLGTGATVAGFNQLGTFNPQAGLYNPFAQLGLAGAAAGFDNMMNGVDLSGLSSLSEGLGGTLTDLGMGFLDMDYSDLASQTTDLLRQQATPFQDRRAAGLFDQLYSRGGSAVTGVANPAVESLGMLEQQEDLGFQLAGLNRADQLSQYYGNLGSNLIGQGAGLYGAADQFNLSKAGMQIQGDQGLANSFANLLQSGAGAYGTASEINQQDFANALAQIGLGSGMTQTNFNNLLSMLTTQHGIAAGAAGQNVNAGMLGAQRTGNLFDLLGGFLASDIDFS